MQGITGIGHVALKVRDIGRSLELFPGTESDRSPGWNANCITHLCLTVDDLDRVVEAVEARGIGLLIEKKAAADGNQAWIEDPDGNRVELMEMNPASMQLEAIRRLQREGR